MYSTKTYQIEVPEETWKTLKQVHDDRGRINSRIVELIAEDVREHQNGDLDPGVRAEITRILGGGDDGI